ncbi:MAG: ABC transporter ATP-binding protein [Sphingobacteriales bacterium]|nr:MAG: ABC transporter ATP-binding protein [Sphingobacteriales bacterium]
MLQALHLLKKHSTLTVVDDVSLQIAKGEIVSITGPSGAGKSSLLHLLSGLDRPDSGTVHLDGTDIFQLSAGKQAQFRARNIGFVFQAHHLLPEFSALENAAMPLWIGGKSRKEGLQLAAEIMQVVGLSHRLTHKPAELSGGEQQRVAIARALVARPAVVFADEPTGNLDSANAEAIHELFLQLREALGQTFVIVTHNEALAQRADRTIAMRDGRILTA